MFILMDWEFLSEIILLIINLLVWEDINSFVLSFIAWSIILAYQRHSWTYQYQDFLNVITSFVSVMNTSYFINCLLRACWIV